MIKIMFVCLGNICRSPLAHAVMEQKIAEAGLSEKILVDSSGTGDWHIGHRSDARMITEAKKHGIAMTHLAQQLHFTDKSYDYIFAMDYSNFANIKTILKVKHDGLKMFRCYDTVAGDEVPDPYFGGAEGFSEVYKMVDRNCDCILVQIKEKHALK